MREKISVTKSSGEIIEADLVNAFIKKDNNLKYLMYTLNEVDSSNLIKLYVSKVSGEAEPFTLDTISDETEWTSIKGIMKELVEGNTNNVQYIETGKSFKGDSKVIALPVGGVYDNDE